MLYPKNKNSKIDLELFQNPTAEYRCTPFWAWNCDLKKEELFKEIDTMQEMGMGGFHMHTRVGMSTTYLSDDYMAFIRACMEKAKEKNMLAWLYDEDKWPSGFAGGYVTQKKENRQKYILFTATPYEKAAGSGFEGDASAKAKRTNNGTLLAVYDVILDEEGYLSSYRVMQPGEAAKGTAWYCYLETSAESPWFNYQTYVDVLSKSAIDDFIAITHERYKEVVGEEFGKTVPAIFTDEPQVTTKTPLQHAKDTTIDITLPFTSNFEETYRAAYGESFLEKFPEVVWNLKNGVSVTRYRYHDHVAERFVKSFCDNVGNWCEKNGIALTGHVMNEPMLGSQTASVGEAMRTYRKFTIPGVDMLCDEHEFTTVKQAASAAHQYGREGVLSELYGVTNWDYDFRGHKLQGDWQAALGVSVRVPHLYWVSMKGEAKRDYPASIGHQSAWYKEYSYIENHFARVNTLMTRGKADIKIGVIHPVESLWLHAGPNDQSSFMKNRLEDSFKNTTEWLLSAGLDFDYICESTLPNQYRESSNGFTVGEMTYDVVLVPDCLTLRSTTLQRLQQFAENGGEVVFAGSYPQYIDAVPNSAAEKISSKLISMSRSAILEAMEPYRSIKITEPSGYMVQDVVYGMRQDGDCKNLFLCHNQNKNRDSIHENRFYTVKVRGEYAVTLFNTLNGTTANMPSTHENGWTVFQWENNDHSSLLVQLSPKKEAALAEKPAVYSEQAYVTGPVEYTLAEPNVCVLDKARWRIDSGAWHAEEESICIAVLAKKELNLPVGTAVGAQPWAFKKEAEKNTVTLEYSLYADMEVQGAELALEEAQNSKVWFNGELLTGESYGYYVDYSITKLALPKIQKGKNTVTVEKPFGVTSNTENMFVLGNFGVTVLGTSVKLVPAAEKLYFDDLTRQGLPFYGGAVIYKLPLTTNESTALALGVYHAGCVTVTAQGVKQNISLAPYVADLSYLTPGENTVEITVYNSRINTFGQLHLNDADRDWFGPDAWRTEGKDYKPEYNLKTTGLLSAPRLLKKEK